MADTTPEGQGRAERTAGIEDEERFRRQLRLAVIVAAVFALLAVVGAILATSVFG